MKNNNNIHEKKQMFQKFDSVKTVNEMFEIKRKNLLKKYIIDVSIIFSIATILFLIVNFLF